MNLSRKIFLPLGLLTAIAPHSLSAAIIPVTVNADSGAGSLRQAMTTAAANDTIDCSAITGQTITLTSGNLPSLSSTVIINGSNITVDQGGLFSAFTMTNTGDIVNDVTLINAPAFPPADTTVASSITFTGSDVDLVNITTSGATTLNTGSSVTGTATVNATGSLNLDSSTLTTLDTFGSTTLQNSSSITGTATVETSGQLQATNSSLSGPLIDMGTVTLTNTPVSNSVSVSNGASFAGIGSATVLSSLSNAGTATLNNNASVSGSTAVLSTGVLTVNNSTLSTLDTFGITNLQNVAQITGAATVESTGQLTSSQSSIGSLNNAGTATLSNGSSVTGSTTVLSTGTLTVDNSTLNTLENFGITTLQNGAQITGAASVESTGQLTSLQSSIGSLNNAGTATLSNGSSVTGATTVLSTGMLTVDNSTLNTLNTFGSTTLQNGAQILGLSTIQSSGQLNATNSFLAGPMQDFGTVNFFNTQLTNNLTIAPGASFQGDNSSSIIGTVNNAGVMRYNGQVIGNVTIQPTGSLSGTAAIQGALTNQGLVSPGIGGHGSILATNYTQTNSGTFEAVLNPSTTGFISGATAQLDGNLSINLLPGSYTSPKNYTILQTTGPLTGTFSSASVSTPALVQVLYFPTEVRLQVVPLSALNLSGNALSAAGCIFAEPILLPPDSDQAAVRNALLQLTLDQFQPAFNQMQPSQYSALTWVQLTNMVQMHRSLFRHFPLWQAARNFGGCPTSLPNLPDPASCSSVGKPLCDLQQSPCCFTPTAWHSWLSLSGNVQRQTTSESQYGFIDRGFLLQGGVDASWDANSLGFTAGYQFDRLDWNSRAGHSTMNTLYTGLYALHTGRHYVVDVSCLFGYTNYDTTREIQIPGLNRSAKTSFHSYEGLAGIGLGSFNTLCGFDWIPFARLDYCYLSQPSFLERDAKSLNLRVGNYAASLVQMELGVLFQHTYTLECGLINPKLQLSYLGQYSPQHKHWNANFRQRPSCRFSATGWNYNRNLFAPTLAFTFFGLNRQFSVEVGYDGRIGNNFWSQQAYVQMDWKF